MIITKKNLFEEKERYSKMVKGGAIFLHPTDTINGLGVIATNDKAVKRLRDIKGNKNSPMSVIVPSKAWIRENCILTKEAEKWLKKLPGPYTLVLNLKNKDAVSRHVNPKDSSLGVRIPKHWISDFVRQIGVPVITTTANLHGEEYKDNIEELHPKIVNNTDFIIYDTGARCRPSDVVILTGEEPQVIRRQ